MNPEGYTPVTLERWGSYAKTDDPRQLPFLDVLLLSNDMRYGIRSTRTRPAVFQTVPSAKAVKGLGMLLYKAATEAAVLLYNTADGLFKEVPAGSGAGTPVAGALVPFPDCYAQYAQAYNNAYIALGDLTKGLARPAVYSGARSALEPLSMLPIGGAVERSRAYFVGEIVTPGTANGHTYRCTTAGTTGVIEPAYTTGAGDVIPDGTAVFTEMTPTLASSAAAGNICTGTRWMVVLFENNNGYISGISPRIPVSANLATGAKQVDVAQIFTGPANTARRWVGFTVSGGSSVGPYFFLPGDDVENGVSMTKTSIEGNVATTASFNFTDEYLITGEAVDDYFRIGQIPECMDVQFCATTQIMVYTGVDGYRSGHIVAPPNDPETFFTDTGIVQVAENDGTITQTWREFRKSNYSYKENSFHAVSVGPTPPSEWPVYEVSGEVGIMSPRCVAEVEEQFQILAHDSGPYRFDGQNTLPIGLEIIDDWRRINKLYKHTCWVEVDTDQQEIYFGVPLDNATSPSHVFVMSYQEGWAHPLISLIGSRRRQGRRKWSLWTIATYVGKKVRQRALAAAPDATIATSQMLFGSAADGTGVQMLNPAAYSDRLDGNAANDTGIPWAVETCYGPAGKGVFRLHGFDGMCKGNGGTMAITVTQKVSPKPGEEPRSRKVRGVPLVSGKELYWERPCKDVNEGFKVRLENLDDDGVVQKGCWVELHQMSLWARLFSRTRRG